MSKRILSLVLTLALVLGSFSMAFADTTATTTNTAVTPAEKIAELQRLGFIKGDDSGDLKLQDPIKRSETAIIVSKAVVSGGDKDMAAVEKEIELSRYQSRFSDVPTSYRSNPYINVAVQKAIVNGYPDNTFRPDRDIKYSEVITMMVGILGEKPTPGVKYPDNYIGKARELGLLEGINVNYVGQAQRQGVFELLYNTLTNNKVGNYNIDKVLVLENNRVESIGANELVVEVIKEVQRANFADDSRSGDADERRGDQLRITVPSDSELDVEDLVGKVVDLSYDKANNAVRAQVDTSYSYVSGPIVAKGDKLEVGTEPNEKSYTAVMDEKYSSKDDRVFRTYVNDKDYSYSSFAKDVKSADFAKVTIKNGKVLFIDAFNFDDVAPVKEVKKDGSEVFVYNDSRDGDVKRIDFKDSTKVVAVKDGKFTRATLKDIGALDVVHVYGDNKVIVRKASEVKDTYKKVSEDKYGYFVTVGDKAYEISTVNNKKSVYSYDSKKFYTLEPKDSDRQLRDFRDEKVTLLLDVNNNVQYFGSEIEAGEFVAGVDSVVGKEARLVKSDNTKEDYTATLDTKVELNAGSTAHKNLNDLNKLDIVYVSAKDNELDKVYRLATKANVTSGEKSIVTDSDGDYILNKNVIETTEDEYKLLNRTNVFYYDGNKVVATTLNKLTTDKLVSGLKAYVITDEDYDLNTDNEAKRSTTGLANVANTIVFTSNPFKNETSKEKVQITGVYASGSTYELEVKDEDGTKTTKVVDKDSQLHTDIERAGIFQFRTSSIGSVVELEVNKNDDKEVSDYTTLISVNADVFEVVSTSSTSGYRQITFKDVSGKTETIWTNTNVSEFGNVGTSGSKVSISKDKGEINAILVKSNSTPLKGLLSGAQQNATGIVTYKNITVGSESFSVDSKTPYFLNAKTILRDKNNNVVAMGAQEVINALTPTVLTVKGDQVEVTFSGDVMTIKRIATSLELKEVQDKVITTKGGLEALLANGSYTVVENDNLTINAVLAGSLIVTADAGTGKTLTVNGTLTLIEDVTNTITLDSGVVVNATGNVVNQ